MNVEKHFEFHSKKNKPQPDKATALQRFMSGLQCMVDAAKEKNHPTVQDSAAAIAEHAALVAVADSFLVEENPYRTPEQVKALAALAAVRGGAK
jgi:hypothetical protein